MRQRPGSSFKILKSQEGSMSNSCKKMRSSQVRARRICHMTCEEWLHTQSRIATSAAISRGTEHIRRPPNHPNHLSEAAPTHCGCSSAMLLLPRALRYHCICENGIGRRLANEAFSSNYHRASCWKNGGRRTGCVLRIVCM